MGFHETPLPRVYRGLGILFFSVALIIVVCLQLLPADPVGFALLCAMASISGTLGVAALWRARRSSPEESTSVFWNLLSPEQQHWRRRVMRSLGALTPAAVTLWTGIALSKVDSGDLSRKQVPSALLAMHDHLGRWPTVFVVALVAGASWAVLARLIWISRSEREESAASVRTP